jgi:hypothetical protein
MENGTAPTQKQLEQAIKRAKSQRTELEEKAAEIRIFLSESLPQMVNQCVRQLHNIEVRLEETYDREREAEAKLHAMEDAETEEVSQ